MIVAARAAHRQAQPDGRRGFDAIDDVLDGVLFGDDAAFGVGAMIAIEAGGDVLLERGIGQQIAGQLLDRELIERQVAVVGLDHPIAPPPHVAVAVDPGSRWCRHSGPRRASAPPSARRSAAKPAGDRPRARRRRAIGRPETLDLGGRRRQAGQVERHAAQERRLGGLRRERQALGLQARQHERIDGIVERRGFFYGRNRRTHGRDERPMRFPFRAFTDPTRDPFDLVGRELLARAGRRHPLFGIGTGDALVENAGRQIAGHDRADTVHAALGAGFDVEPQIGLPLRRVGTVALKAVVGQERANVAIELHRLVGARSACARTDCGQ